jgi:hypothetical protein
MPPSKSAPWLSTNAKIGLAAMTLGAIWLTGMGFAVYVAAHFIDKYW